MRHVHAALCACALVPLLAAPARAQAPVSVTFRVFTSNGQPLLDVRRGEVSLKVDGKPRPVTSLELQRLAAGLPDAARVLPSFATNDAADPGRDVVFLLDDEGLVAGKEQNARQAMTQLAGRLSPADRIGMMSLRTGGLTIQPTRDREAITAAINGYRGQAFTSESAADLECRTTQIIETVRALLAGATSGRTIFVMISTGTAPLPAEQVRQRLGTSSGLCLLRPQHFSDLAAAAGSSPAVLYVLHDVDSRVLGTSDPTAGLESLAGATRSPLIRLTGNSPQVVSRIAEETAGLYVLTFSAAGTERDGLVHRAEIDVARPGARVDGGGNVRIPRPAKGLTPADVLKNTTPYVDLPLRATAYAVRDAPGSQLVKVVAVFESPDPAVQLATAAVGFVSGSRLIGRWTAEADELRRRPVMAAVSVPPGKYRVRVAAADASGRIGSVDYELDATLATAGTLKTSALALGVADRAFMPRLLFGPADEVAVGYLEIYGVAKNAVVTGRVELAPSEQGPAIATAPATLQPASADDMRIAYGGFAIGPLEPGDYVLRMVITVDGKVALTATRALRKTS